MEQEESPKLDLGSLGSFDFTPDWAKKDAGVTVGKVRPERDRPAFGDKKSFGDKRQFGEKRSFGEKRQFGPKKPFSRDGDRKPFGRGPAPERPRPLDVDIKILPETKALGTIIRKLQQDAHAYKLKDLAYFFLDNPQSVLLKITPRAAEGAQAQQTFCQCKACGFASVKEEDVVEHALSAHLSDYYDSKEVEVEPPKGNFSCVAKCGLSGELLGPPNIHEFNAIVKEMIRTRYPDMSEEQYRSKIEMVRDPETIEAWRKGAVKKTVFVPKGQAEVEGVATLTREQAEGEFRRTVLPSLIDRPKNLMLTADVAMKSPVKPLVWAVRDALELERRSPYNMCFALRGAFHHRKLNFFRANDARGPEFVTSAELKEFDAAHAIPELAAVAKFIAEHPCCDRTELPAGEGTLQHLQWLVSTGHVVAFAKMGVYSAVEKFPKYGPQWKKRSAKAAAPQPAAEAAPAPEVVPAPEAAPAAETPAAEAPVEPAVEEVPAAPVAEEAPAAPEAPVAQDTTVSEEKKEEPQNEAPTQLAE